MYDKSVVLRIYCTKINGLCTKHQNFALKLKALRKEGINVTQNPDEFLKQGEIIDEQKIPDRIVFSKWKRFTMKDNKQRMKVK